MKRALMVFVVLLAGATVAVGQTPTSAHLEPSGPVIEAIEIVVIEPGTREELGVIPPRGTYVLRVGETVRLRVRGIPAGGRTIKWPTAEFEVISGQARVRVLRENSDVGTITLLADKTENRGNPRAATLVRYRVTERLNTARGVRLEDTVTLEIVAAAEPEPEPEPEPDVGERRGVTLYEHQDFRGRFERFFADDPYLNDNLIRQDTASSIRVDRGCRAILYEHPNFEGSAAVLNQDETDLARTRVGSDRASSLRVECGESGPQAPRRGVTLYEHQDFRGRSEFFYLDDPQLSDNPIRQDTASSARVDRGCQVTLYEHPDYRGRATVLTSDAYDLSGTRVGNDSVSSLQVDCGR